MIDVTYGEKPHTLTFEAPSSWTAPTGVNITVTRNNGTEVLASTAATLPTATTLGAETARGATTLTAGDAARMAAGQRWRIEESANGPAEDLYVLNTDGSTAVTLRERLEYGHKSGIACDCLTATYGLDCSSSTNYPLHAEYTIEWESDSANEIPVVQMMRIVKRRFGLYGFEQHFEQRYRDLWRTVRQRWATLEQDVYRDLASWIGSKGFELERLMDSDEALTVSTELMRWKIVDMHGDRWTDDRKPAWESFQRALDLFCTSAHWADMDEDLTEDENETKIPTRTYTSRNL